MDVCAKVGWSMRNCNEGYAGNEGLRTILWNGDYINKDFVELKSYGRSHDISGFMKDHLLTGPFSPRYGMKVDFWKKNVICY